MLPPARLYGVLILILCNSAIMKAQPLMPSSSALDFAEFNKRPVLPIEAGLGFSSRQSKALFSVQASPQFTLINHQLRLGATVGGAYTTTYPDQLSEHWIGYAGPKLSYKLKQLELKLAGLPQGIAFGNLNVFLEHLWGGNNVKLFGGGIAVELAKKASVSIKCHRDYEHQSTWGQLGLSYNFIPQKKPPTFPNNP
ncbi:hypothetical protein [Spirosoma validum]|uniref:Uncharacterized protein n=1 Tax=Spirosoma validum TaxID=2771355 RepID=A0A927GCQ6_9BACT|nr:hypothetical protein [Spirosoma validum]MBD2752888.1 hypothetical protein [Spirosoma validum]